MALDQKVLSDIYGTETLVNPIPAVKDVPPEAAAEGLKYNRAKGIDALIAAKNLPTLKAEDEADQWDDIVKTSPITARRMSNNPAFAAAAKNDVHKLGVIEATLKSIGNKRVVRGREFNGLIDELMAKNPWLDRQTARQLAGETVGVDNQSALIGEVQAVKPSVKNIINGLMRTLPEAGETARSAIRLQFADAFGMQDLGRSTMRQIEKQKFRQTLARPQFETETGQALYAGADSFIRMAPAIAASLITKSPATGLAIMGGQAQTEAYNKYRERGGTALESFGGAAGEAGVEVLTEMLPLKFLVDRFGKEATQSFLGAYLTREMPTEQVATFLQDAIDTAVANPDKSWDEFWSERPSAAYQTAVATLLPVGVMSGLNYVATKMGDADAQAEKADATLKTFTDMNNLASQVTLKQLSSQDFAEFIQEAGGEANVPEVFINARTFMQEAQNLGIDLNELQQSSPAIGQQLEESSNIDTDIIIPIGEFSSTIAGTEFGKALLPHLRANDDDISAFEAKTQLDTALTTLQAEAEKVIERQVNADEWKSSLKEVGDNLLSQLDASGMFDQATNRTYVNGLVTPFYSTLAGDLGITPSEAYARYPLRVGGDVQSNVMEQSAQTDTPEFRNWFSDSKVVDNEGKPLVVYHGTNQDIESFLAERSGTNTNSASSRAGFFFTTSSAEAGDYANMSARKQVSNAVEAEANAERLLKAIKRAENRGDFDTAERLYMELEESEQEAMTGDERGANIVPVYLDIKNPFVFDMAGKDLYDMQAAVDEAKANGHDGVRLDNVWDPVADRDNLEETTQWIAFAPTQIKSATGNRGTFDPNDPNILNQSSEPIFYSALSRAINEVQTKKAEPSAWKGMIKNLTQKGVKPDEIEWSGVNEWLDLQQGSVTKEQVLDYLDANGVRVEETQLGVGNDRATKELNDIYGAFERGEITRLQRRSMIDELSFRRTTKYEKYTVPGGSNYKELLLTLPAGEKIPAPLVGKIEFLSSNGKYVYQAPGGTRDIFDSREAAEEEQKHVSDIFDKRRPAEKFKGGFQSSHFDQPNILAHIRFDERTDADGKRVLFIQELQSDWGQTGKKKGFDNEKKFESLIQQRDTTQDETERQRLQDEINAMGRNMDKGVPSAPFVTKTDAWVSLALKRMVRYAAENGFDSVAFINGDQAADLYDLSKQVDSVRANKDSGKYNIYAERSGSVLVQKQGLDIGEVTEIVGKDLAEKIENDSAYMDGGGTKKYSGLDLKIGGSGMRIFYDQIVPKVAKDVLKKLGGGVDRLSISSENKPIENNEYTLKKVPAGWSVLTRKGVNVFDTEREARQFAIEKFGGESDYMMQPGFTITDDMRAKIMQGLPLFQKDNESARGQISFTDDITKGANITLLKNADLSTFVHEVGHFFLEVYADISSRTDAPQKIVDDMNTLLEYYGVQDIAAWNAMTLEQKRDYHEQTARDFEQYIFEGKAPSLSLRRIFAKLRAFMLDAYKSISKFLSRNGDKPLKDDVRQVFDRMLANDSAIDEAIAVRGMIPLFSSFEESGMDVEQYARYIQANQDSVDEAKNLLDVRSMRDLKWLRNARNKVIRGLQKEARDTRREVRIEARREIMSQPVYQAMSWLKQLPDDAIAKAKKSSVLDPENDNLFTAIAKLGGINKQTAMSEWGIDPEDKFDSGVFGKPVLRKTGGLTVDGMAEALSQYGYLATDENGKYDLIDLEDKFFNQSRGENQYSLYGESAMMREWAEDQELDLEALGKGKIDLAIMKAVFGEADDAPWRKLGVGRTGMVMSDGLSPDEVASYFGFNSGAEIVGALVNAQDPVEAVESLTDAMMLERYGELVRDSDLQEAADEAVHNQLRSRVIASELAAQNKALGGRRVLQKAAQLYAEQRIDETQVNSIKPNLFVRAETKAAAMAEKSMRDGNTQAVVQAKRDQLLNNASARVAYEALDDIDKTLRKLRQLQKASVQKNMRGEYRLQLNAIFERFDLRTSITQKELEDIAGKPQLSAWVKEEADRLTAAVPDLPEFVLNETYRKSYKEMTYQEFKSLAGVIKQLEKLARRENEQYKAIKDQTFYEEKNALIQQIRKSYPKAFDKDGNLKNDIKLPVPSLEKSLADSKDGVLSSYISIPGMAEIIDGGEIGPAFDSLFSRLTAAADWKSKKTSEIFTMIRPLMRDQYSAVEKFNFGRKDIGTETLGIPITREMALVTALLYGNPEGRQRLSNWGWDDAMQQRIIGLLDEKDFALADAIWTVFDEVIWPDLKAVNERTLGIAPPKVDQAPYDTKYGRMKGGYFPIDYDARDNNVRVDSFEADKSLDSLRAGIGIAKKTRQGTSQQRVTETKYKPKLSLSVFSNTVNETLHDIAYREAFADTQRMLKDDDVAAAIKSTLGYQHYKAIVRRVGEISVPPVDATDWLEKTMNIARKNTVATLLSGASTALMNFTGLVPALTKVQPAYMAREVARFYSVAGTKKQIDFAIQNSDYLKGRIFQGYDRDLNSLSTDLSVKNKLLPDTKYALFLMGMIDSAVVIPTWNAAFAQGMEQYSNDKARAVQFADSVIQSTMGSGRDVDQPLLTSGKDRAAAAKSLFLMFFNYFRSQGERLVVAGAVSRQAYQTNKTKAVADFTLKYIAIVALPALLNEFIFGWGGDDDDDYIKRAIESMVLYQTAMIPFVRDLARPIWHRIDPDVKAFGYKLSPVESTINQGVGLVDSLPDIASGEGDDKDIKNAIMGVSFLTGLPGKLISDTYLGIQAYMNDEAGPEAIVFGVKK